MRASLVAAGACAFAVAGLFSSAADARGRGDAPARAGHHRAAAASLALRGKIAVQPVDCPTHANMNMAALRALVVRIVRGRGFRTVTSLPRYEGTAQYPGLARDHHLAAFVTADLEERGSTWQRITFLVWNGATGSVLGRWSASGQSTTLGRTVGRGFWAHLGPALAKAEAPGGPGLAPAPTMRIDASDRDADNARTNDRINVGDRDGTPVAQR